MGTFIIINDKTVTSHHQTTDVCCDVIDHVVALLCITLVSVHGYHLVFVTRHEKMCLKYGLDTLGGNKRNKLTE